VSKQVGSPDWGLDLNDEAGLAGVDLGDLGKDELRAESGWAALAGGLLLAREDREPRIDVWATGAWHWEFGIASVEGIEDKLGVAAEWGVRTLFLPAENQVKALEWLHASGKEIEIEPLMPSVRHLAPEQVLRKYLARLGAEPPIDAPFARRRSHYVSSEFPEAQDYYWRCLLDDAVSRCAKSLRGNDADWSPTHLVSVVSGTASIVAMAPLAAGVKHCLLLHEGDEKNKVPQNIAPTLSRVIERLEAKKIECLPRQVRVGERAGELARIKEHLQSFATGVDPNNLVVDLTPGFKPLTLALAEVAPPGCWLIYCRHRQVVDQRVDPGTESHERWRR
jgi:hypothetical protein